MSSWLEWAAEQGNAAIQAFQEDLGEFTTVVSEDTAAAAEEAAVLARAHMNRVEGKLDELDVYVQDQASAGADDPEYFAHCRLQKLEAALRRDETCFLTDPAASDDAMEYVEWLETFEPTDHTDEQSELLNANPDFLKMHINLVPSQVTNSDFWVRYFWNREKIAIAEQRRIALLEKASTEVTEEQEEGWADWEQEPEAANSPAIVPSDGVPSQSDAGGSSTIEKCTSWENLSVPETTHVDISEKTSTNPVDSRSDAESREAKSWEVMEEVEAQKFMSSKDLPDSSAIQDIEAPSVQTASHHTKYEEALIGSCSPPLDSKSDNDGDDDDWANWE